MSESKSSGRKRFRRTYLLKTPALRLVESILEASRWQTLALRGDASVDST